MKKGVTAFLIGTVFCLLAGCGSDKTPVVSSIAIDKEGAIHHTIVGEFDQSYYDIGELERLAGDRVAEYTSSYGADSIKLNAVKEEDRQIVIDMTYANIRDYTGFNHRELYCGPITEARNRGYQIENVAFVTKDGDPVEPGSIENLDKLNVAIVEMAPQEKLLVNLNGKVLYINQSAMGNTSIEFAGKKSVLIQNGEAADSVGKSYSYAIYE